MTRAEHGGSPTGPRPPGVQTHLGGQGSLDSVREATGDGTQQLRGHDRAITVLLVDDQPLLRSGFAMVLSTESDIEVVGTAANGVEAVEAVQSMSPDVVLMDVQMPVLDGIEATRQILAQSLADGRPPTKVVILTTFDRDDYLFDALDAGASGFLLKNAEADDLVAGVRTVHDGHALLAPEVTRRVIAAAHTHPASLPPESAVSPESAVPSESAQSSEPTKSQEAAQFTDERQARAAAAEDALLDALTVREREVLATMADGLSNAEIAATLFLSEATVKTHVSRVLAKLGVRDRVQAVIAAYRAGLVPPHG